MPKPGARHIRSQLVEKQPSLKVWNLEVQITILLAHGVTDPRDVTYTRVEHTLDKHTSILVGLVMEQTFFPTILVLKLKNKHLRIWFECRTSIVVKRTMQMTAFKMALHKGLRMVALEDGETHQKDAMYIGMDLMKERYTTTKVGKVLLSMGFYMHRNLNTE